VGFLPVLAAALLAAPGASAPGIGGAAGPAQPLEFSHRIHAGEAGIGCTSCHAYAERGPVAGIPSMARCQGCHKFVREDPERPARTAQMKPLLAILRSGQAIAWVRVHRLPDHVYFTHERHVRAEVACRACHGAVEQMDVVSQVAPLTMGWCLACHHEKQRERPGQRARLTECVTCHK
jgi:hypothetical protein